MGLNYLYDIYYLFIEFQIYLVEDLIEMSNVKFFYLKNKIMYI